jgi:hypothetical protein
MKMTQDSAERISNEQPQVYDASFKSWISQQAPTIVPVLLPGAVYEATLDIEIIRPIMRVDKAFKIRYHGEEHILHLEFEAGYDSQLKSRLLVYNAVLYRDHRLPVLTIVIYPFRVTMAQPPLRILSRNKPLLTFLFKTLPLFELDAREIVQEHHVAMYPLVPTMKHVHADLISQVMQELTELYRNDEVTLSQQIVWLELLLERTTTIKRAKKEEIKERLKMFEQLFEESPMIQKMREQYRMQGVQQGIQQGIQQGVQQGVQQGLLQGLQSLQRSLVNIVKAKYPDLAEFAQQQANRLDKPEMLESLIQQVAVAPNAATVRQLLEAGAKF